MFYIWEDYSNKQITTKKENKSLCCITSFNKCNWIPKQTATFYLPTRLCSRKIFRVPFRRLTMISRVWARPRHSANPALQLKLSLKKTVKETICPLQNLGKKLERKHTRRVLSRYRNCKLKQNVESIFSCTFKVHSKVTFQSHFTEHVRLMLNQAWWTHVAIFTTLFTNMRTQKFKSRLHNYVFRCPQS